MLRAEGTLSTLLKTAVNSCIEQNASGACDTVFGGVSGPPNNWNTTGVTNMYGLFWGASAFNQPLDKWDVKAVINMGEMFERAAAFNQSLDNWNTSAVTDMDYMFNHADAFNNDITSWNCTAVLNESYVFYGAGGVQIKSRRRSRITKTVAVGTHTDIKYPHCGEPAARGTAIAIGVTVLVIFSVVGVLFFYVKVDFRS